ncbi:MULTISPECIES: MarR family winged helix-turn-helix transcriptional regulator [Mixta]|uniref:MarR family winged helix-turn-helix transcriptional regulator n=1 Tax=Mixta TaxID=2100764 RepID=UPI000535BB9B|nr:MULTISPECIES: MarR family transcriptional regulator [Mixta]AIX73772.1 transcriptional regulator [Pantoea sp. PSNIH2]MBS6057220.1 MarR family transcriptional regulator [Pantoea sp.]POU45092.1 MarR family transcriptional regulator [Pantoea sp. PSNIH5]POU63718.1 MarR family transcriptional regulator [Pantoea sp. PSNIH4]POY67073.1 MarR family transcriptional regulator [Pantoea sp. PSNIH3]
MHPVLDREAFHLMRQLFQEHTACWQQLLPDLTKPQYSVLRAVADKPGIEQVELMDAAVSTKATLAEMLSRLEKRGVIRREHAPEDKRRRFVYLTAEGEVQLKQAMPLANEVDRAFLSRLTADEQETFVQLLGKMARTSTEKRQV